MVSRAVHSHLRSSRFLFRKKNSFSKYDASFSTSARRKDRLSSEPPSRSFEGKVAIVTGAGCAGDGIGNGRAISIMLAREGCDVLCLDRNLTWAQRTAEMINENGQTKASAISGDVTSAQNCEDSVQAVLERYGRLDILVYNVGTAGAPGTAVDVGMDFWAHSLKINVSRMVLMSKFAIPAMLRNTTEMKGSIINMGSVAGLKGGTPHLLYPTSKGAVVNMTRAMAAHHAEAGIRVNCVCPGVSQPNSAGAQYRCSRLS
jgi:NAD(P)-dependent dehydrogenase (short-subunit alcohol dehydrogenase family)